MKIIEYDKQTKINTHIQIFRDFLKNVQIPCCVTCNLKILGSEWILVLSIENLKKKLGICFTDVFPATSLFPNREFFLDVFVPVSAISQNLRRLLKATKKSKRGDVVEKPVEWKFVNGALFFFWTLNADGREFFEEPFSFFFFFVFEYW